MDMKQYVHEVEYALSELVPLVWRESHELDELKNRLSALEREMEDGYRRSDFVAMNAEDPDDVALAAGMYWDTYFGADKDRHYVQQDSDNLESRIQLHAFSRATLAGAVLQIVKQGISTVHPKCQSSPDGRQVGSQTLRNVVWQARNQSMHWEEGNLHQPVRDCFDQLASDFGSQFSEYHQRDLAFDVVNVLEWTTAERVLQDIKTL